MVNTRFTYQIPGGLQLFIAAADDVARFATCSKLNDLTT